MQRPKYTKGVIKSRKSKGTDNTKTNRHQRGNQKS